MKIIIFLLMLQLSSSSIILKPPRQLEDNIDTKNDVNQKLRKIEEKNKEFTQSLDLKIQNKILQTNNQDNQNNKNQQNPSNVKQASKKDQKNKKDETLENNIDNADENANLDKKDNMPDKTDNKTIDPSEREKKKEFLQLHDAQIVKPKEQNQESVQDLQKQPQDKSIDQNLAINNQAAQSDQLQEQKQKHDNTDTEKLQDGKTNTKVIQDLTITKDGDKIEIDKQIKTDANSPDQRKSEEVIITKIGNSKKGCLITKTLIGIFVIISYF